MMIHKESWHIEAAKWGPKDHYEDKSKFAPVERKDPLPSWRDPNWLPEQVDHIQSQAMALMQAAAPPINQILKRMDRVPYRTFLKAKALEMEMDDLSRHLDKYLDKQTMWRGQDYTNMLQEIEEIAVQVRSVYMEALPYLKGERALPQPSEAIKMLQDLETLDEEPLALPDDTEDAEWE